MPAQASVSLIGGGADLSLKILTRKTFNKYEERGRGKRGSCPCILKYLIFDLHIYVHTFMFLPYNRSKRSVRKNFSPNLMKRKMYVSTKSEFLKRELVKRFWLYEAFAMPILPSFTHLAHLLHLLTFM